MCCFSGKVKSVSGTSIFARAAQDGRQYLVYSMHYQADSDLSMILPIPTPANSAEDAVKFINLEKYPNFFQDLNKAFPPKPNRAKSDPAPAGNTLTLPVVEVGSFVASFVPAIKDFARLDEQFRLPAAAWDKLTQYKEFGFAVFKLKKTPKGQQKVHPMAFEFPRFDKDVLFFPTVHIHDGTVPEKAGFDHSLFCQVTKDGPLNWEESPGLAETSVNVKETQGVVDPNGHVYRKLMKGMLDNKDVGVNG